MKERENEKFIQTYVYRDNGETFFVSTGYRKSSATLRPDDWYYETFAWRLDDKGEGTDWVADNSGASYAKRAYAQHMEVVMQLQEKGVYEEVTSD